jgi:DNA-binding MurR/RpiR family transcriptional regulator
MKASLPSRKTKSEPAPAKAPEIRVVEHAAVRAELEKRFQGQRPTPAHRRIAQTLVDHGGEIGFLSSSELANLANVSQPSVSRFAVALGFSGFLDMRRGFRAIADPATAVAATRSNRYQLAVQAEAANVANLATALSDLAAIRRIGAELAKSRPLVVLGLRASSGLATQFSYFAAKVHPDVRLIFGGGSLIEDQLEQAQVAGATVVLAFAMPLYPNETIKSLQFAKQLKLRTIVVSDSSFAKQGPLADLLLTADFSSKLVFDASAAASVLVSVLLDAMCDAMPEQAEARLEQGDQSSKRRKVFAR